jgi:hypothetical protein
MVSLPSEMLDLCDEFAALDMLGAQSGRVFAQRTVQLDGITQQKQKLPEQLVAGRRRRTSFSVVTTVNANCVALIARWPVVHFPMMLTPALSADRGARPVPVVENLLNLTATTLNYLLDNPDADMGAIKFEEYINKKFEEQFPGQGCTRTLSGLAEDQAKMSKLLSKKAELVADKWRAQQKLMACKQEWITLKAAAEKAYELARAHTLHIESGVAPTITGAGFGFSGAVFGFGAQAQPVQQISAGFGTGFGAQAEPVLQVGFDGVDEEKEDKASIDTDGDEAHKADGVLAASMATQATIDDSVKLIAAPNRVTEDGVPHSRKTLCSMLSLFLLRYLYIVSYYKQ